MTQVLDRLKLATDDSLYLPFDAYGGVYHQMSAWMAPKEWSPADIDDAVAEMMPSERCQHEHDCCAQYYGSRGRVAYITYYSDDDLGDCQLAYVHRTYTQNV